MPIDDIGNINGKLIWIISRSIRAAGLGTVFDGHYAASVGRSSWITTSMYYTPDAYLGRITCHLPWVRHQWTVSGCKESPCFRTTWSFGSCSHYTLVDLHISRSSCCIDFFHWFHFVDRSVGYLPWSLSGMSCVFSNSPYSTWVSFPIFPWNFLKFVFVMCVCLVASNYIIPVNTAVRCDRV